MNALLAAVLLVAATTHNVVVLNAGNEPIYQLRAGSASTNAWGAGLLAFDEAIDVSRGQDVAFDAGASGCVVDVEAVYGDGHTEVLPSVNVCTVKQLRFDH